MYVVLNSLERGGKTYYYIDFSVDPRVWVNHRIVTQEEGKATITFPVQGVLQQTDKGTWVIRPSLSTWTYLLHVPCGFRGDSVILVPDTYTRIHVPHYRSPRGALGVSDRVLLSLGEKEHPARFDFKRTGRRVEAQDSYGYVEINTPGAEPKYYYGVRAKDADDFFALLDE